MVSLRDQILADFAALRVPLSGEQLDEVLRTTEQQALSHLEFLQRLVGTQAQQRRQRAVERRIHDAYFREMKLLEDGHHRPRPDRATGHRRVRPPRRQLGLRGTKRRGQEPLGPSPGPSVLRARLPRPIHD